MHGLSSVYPRPNWELASALCLRTLTHCEEPGLVNFPTVVCAREPNSTCSSGVLPGPLAGCEYRLDEGRLSVQTVVLMLGTLTPVLVIKQGDQQHKFATCVLWVEPQGDSGDSSSKGERAAFLNLSVKIYLYL